MVSPENTDWVSEFGFIDDLTVAVYNWPVQSLNSSSNDTGMEMNGTFGEPDPDAAKEPNSKKRGRSEFCAISSSKACREKLRRDRLNDKFMELGSLLEPGKPPKTDKAAILVDAVKMVTQLRGEADKLKNSNSSLQEKIKELKVEKNELRDEKQRLKSEKESLEQQVKAMNTQPSFLPPHQAIPAFAANTQPSFLPPHQAIPAFAAPQGQVHGNKMMPFIGYHPGVAMWQFMPPAAVDTSQDHVLRPPVA